MSGGQTSNTQSNQVSTVQLPPWVNEAAQQNYAFAQNVAARPLQQYQGQTVADVAPATQQSWNLAQTSGTAGQPQSNAATAGNLGVLASGTPTVTAGMLANTDLAPYMNPYVNDVVNTGMQKLEAQRRQAIIGNGNTASASGAFGGSRQGVQEGVTNAQSALAAGQLSSSLMSDAFNTATGNATADLNRQLTAAQGNQSADLTKSGLDLSASTNLEGISNDQQKNALQQFMMLQQAGTGQQTQAQSEIDANVNKFNQAWNYPTDQLNTLLASLGMTPYGKTQTTQGDSTTTTSSSPDFAQAGLGLLSMGSGLFSDKRVKKNVEKVGVHGLTGLPTYSFQYKGQPDNSKKTVGPMAQDVETKFPLAVSKTAGGIRKIHPSAIPGGGGVGGIGVLAARQSRKSRRVGIL